MDPEQRHRLTYALTLAGGIVLIAGALLMLVIMGVVFGLAWGPAQADLPSAFPTWMMGTMVGVMTLIPIVCGAVVLYVARRYGREEGDPRRDGMIAVVAGAVGLVGGGGGFVGAGLAIAGGIMMLTEQEQGQAERPKQGERAA